MPDIINLPEVEISTSQENIKLNQDWIDFFNQNLPVIGKLYDGDLETTAKKLENIIGKAINKSMNGVIWNENKQMFNTTKDDILKALNLLNDKNKKMFLSSSKQERRQILKNWEKENGKSSIGKRI